jgi:integrase
LRHRALVIVLWRTGLRISEALALEDRDLNHGDMAITVRRGKGGKRRIARLDVTASYLRGVAPVELLEPIDRPPPAADDGRPVVTLIL